MCVKIQNQKKAKGEKIYMPNDKEILISKKRFKDGIPVDKILYQEIKKISKKYKVAI